jgi:plastocyanin/ribosomal protein S27E
MTAIQPQAGFTAVRQFRCTNCGGELTLINPRTNYVGCQYCGSVLDARSEAHQIITKLNAPSKFPPRSFVALGMKAVFNGKAYQVIGRTRWKSTYKEYWSEDGETGYSDEVWEYDEWLLMSEYRTYFYLVEDAEGFAISDTVIPKHPNLPAGTTIKDFRSGKSKKVQEYGESKVVYFEGESTYQIKAGDAIRFAEYKEGHTAYLTESRLGTNQEVKEIEFFREQLIGKSEVLKAFENNESIQQWRARIEAHKKRRRFYQAAFYLTSLIFLVLLIGSCSKGQLIRSEEFAVQPPRNPADNLYVGEEPRLLASTSSFTLPDTNGIYRLEIRASMPDNTECWVGAEVLNEQREIINVLQSDFYRASGDEEWYEDGESGIEHWEEVETELAETYRLNRAGKYSAKLYIDPAYPAGTVIYFSIYKEPMLSRYYILGTLIFGLLGVIALPPFYGSSFSKS